MTNTDIALVIGQLFTVARVERVISIDDMYANKAPVEDALGLVDALSPALLEQVFSSYPQVTIFEDPEIRKAQIETLWKQINIGARQGLSKTLQARVDAELKRSGTVPAPIEAVHPANIHTVSVDAEVSMTRPALDIPVVEGPPASQEIDERAVIVLPELLERYNPLFLSLKEWRERKEELFGRQIPRTLILVDENFEREGGLKDDGIRLIRALLTDSRMEILCALLSHGYSPNNIHEQWNALCEREGLPKSRFVLIPKSLLVDDLMGFVRLVKLAVLNGEADLLKTHLSAIIKSADELAERRMADIDIYDFDQIVFKSSEREGVWEPETLLRVFGLFHRDEVRKLAKGNTNIHELAARIRAVSQLPTHSASAPNYKTWKVQRIELYEDDTYLNPYFLPIELGDIFQKDGIAGKKYILLAQPCDLMVRSNGLRNLSINDGLLVEIINKKPMDLNSHAELEYFDPDHATQYFASFKRSYAVKLEVLDFCAFNATGEAIFKYDRPCSETVIPAWKRRYELLRRVAEKTIKRYEELTKAKMSTNDAYAILMRCSNERLFSGTINAADKTIKYHFKRIGRLRSPQAVSLLARYANSMARQAFEHDFGSVEAESVDASEPASGVGQKTDFNE